MRARMALAVSGTAVELREVLLRDKPPSLRQVSPKATVPVLITDERKVLEESLDIMLWTASIVRPGAVAVCSAVRSCRPRVVSTSALSAIAAVVIRLA